MRQALKKAKVESPEQMPDCPVPEPKESTFGFEAITLDTIQKLDTVLKRISKDTIVAFDTETNSLDTKSASLVGFSFALDEEKAYYVPIGHSYLGVGDQVNIDDALGAIRKDTQRKSCWPKSQI